MIIFYDKLKYIIEVSKQVRNETLRRKKQLSPKNKVKSFQNSRSDFNNVQYIFIVQTKLSV